MTKQGHTPEDLVEYLLGNLPEVETDRFDALSVSDRQFADELAAVETDLIDSYIQGQLFGETLARFEGHYLASALRRDKVEFARALQIYGQNHRAEAMAGDVVRAGPERASSGLPGWLGWIANQGNALRWGLAAAAVLLLAAGTWWISGTAANPPVASFVLAPPLRGQSQVTTLSIARRTAELKIRLQLEADDYPSYRVALKEDASTTELWRSGTLTAARKDEGKVLEVRFPATLLNSKIYSLVVSGIGRDGIAELVSDYAFRAEIK